MKRALLTLARSPLGSLIVGIAFASCSKILPVNRVYETDKVLAFKHPQPHWEEHILIVPKKAIKSLHTANEEDQPYIAEIFHVARQILKDNDWADRSYQPIINGDARQEVLQLHAHLGIGKTP